MEYDIFIVLEKEASLVLLFVNDRLESQTGGGLTGVFRIERWVFSTERIKVNCSKLCKTFSIPLSLGLGGLFVSPFLPLFFLVFPFTECIYSNITLSITLNFHLKDPIYRNSRYLRDNLGRSKKSSCLTISLQYTGSGIFLDRLYLKTSSRMKRPS